MNENINVLQVKYDAKYDIIKFILSILVLAIHSSLYPMILYPWLRIAVPLFFIMSSYFLFSKLFISSETNHKATLKKFVFRNLRLYFCWFFILMPVTLYIRKELFLYNGYLKNILNIIKCIIFGSTFIASWFIMATVIGVLIIYYFSRWLKYDCIIFCISFFAFCVVTLKSSYSSIIDSTLLSTAIDKYIDLFGSLVCSFPASLFWIFIGKMFAENKIKFKSVRLLICLIICSALLLFIEWRNVVNLDGTYNNDSYFMLAPLCVLLFIGIKKIGPIYWENSKYFKHLSTIIYVSHGSILPIISKLISIIFNVHNSLLSFLLTFLCCFVIYILIEFINKNFSKCKFGKVLKMLY